MGIKLVSYLDYTVMHGQQNIKIYLGVNSFVSEANKFFRSFNFE